MISGNGKYNVGETGVMGKETSGSGVGNEVGYRDSTILYEVNT